MPDDNTTEESIQNLTAKRLTITGNNDNVLVLAPFEKNRKLSSDQMKLFPNLPRLEMRNIIQTLSSAGPGDFESQFKTSIFLCGILAGVAIYIGHGLTKDNPSLNRWVWIGGVSLGLLGAAIMLSLLRWGPAKAQERVQGVLRWTAQFFSLLLILVLGIGLPAIVIYFFGGGRELLGGQTSLAALGRSLQLLFIATASFLPALLYFLFDRQQLGTLRQRFEQQIFRLDPNVQSLVDVRAKYGRQIDEIYGRETASGEGRLARGTRLPILVATLVITLGWILVLLPAGPGVDITQPSQLLNFFLPQRTAMSFGFLGAYFFVLNTVLHRYVRADLKPKAYSSMTVRIISVIILAWVIGLPFSGNNYELAFAFMIGVFPESGLTIIRESIRRQTGLGQLIPYTKEKFPLTELEELDVYDRARLLDEGVTNIESLAHHDLIDLMLETRIPVPRLVDWVDQAILYLHLEFDGGEKTERWWRRSLQKKSTDSQKDDDQKKKVNEVDHKEELRRVRQWLRTHYVRTATDFIVAYADGKGPLNEDANDSLKRHLKILSTTIDDDEWLNYIIHWRTCINVQEEIQDASSKAVKVELEEDPAASSNGGKVVDKTNGSGQKTEPEKELPSAAKVAQTISG